MDFTICLYTIQRIKKAVDFYIHLNTYFYIKLKYFFSAIDTWKTIFHDRLTTGTNKKCRVTSHRTCRFFIRTLTIFMNE